MAPNEAAQERRVKIVWVLHMYPPGGGGAEWYAHEFLLALRRREHKVYAWDVNAPDDREFEGVPVVRYPPRQADVIVGHLGNAGPMLSYARQTRALAVWVSHAYGQMANAGGFADLYVGNSERTARERHDAEVMRPHVPRVRYRGPRGDHVTLVNVSEWKGGNVLRDLARRMPDRPFLGVQGAWGTQLLRPGRYDDNLVVWPLQPDIRAALGATSILLAPSSRESWGRIAVEAACRGIPTIAHTCDGIVEAMGNAAIYAHRDHPEEWMKWIAKLLDVPGEYDYRRRRAERQAVRLEKLTLADQAHLIGLLER